MKLPFTWQTYYRRWNSVKCQLMEEDTKTKSQLNVINQLLGRTQCCCLVGSQGDLFEQTSSQEDTAIINALCSHQRLQITACDIIFLKVGEVDLFVMCIWSQLDSLSHFSCSHYLCVLCHTNSCWRHRWILCGARWQACNKWKRRASSQHIQYTGGAHGNVMKSDSGIKPRRVLLCVIYSRLTCKTAANLLCALIKSQTRGVRAAVWQQRSSIQQFI